VVDNDRSIMLKIPCPWCGERAELEFRCAGPVKPLRRDVIGQGDEAWLAYLYHTDNRRAVIEEHWCHEKGCGEWFRLYRHTETHAIVDPDPESER